MKKTKKSLALLMAAAMAVTGLAGCSKSTPAPTTGAPAAESAATTAAGGESSAAESAAPETTGKQTGGSIKISTPQTLNTFFMPQSSSTGDRFTAAPVLESLGRVDEDGNYYPWLAEEFVTDPDALTFTIKLRDGVKFHDGSVCDAEAVAWNIQQ